MTTLQYEAIQTFKSILENYFTNSVDIKNLLRRCFHACQLLGWAEQQTWFNNELNGYTPGTDLPFYRKITGYTKWIPAGGCGLRTASEVQIADSLRTEGEPSLPVNLDIWAGIDFIISASAYGYTERTGRKSTEYSSFRNRDVEIIEMNTYDKSLFLGILQNIENIIFKFTSKSYSLLCYGDSIKDVWQSYRNLVEQKILSIGLGGHLDAIRTGLNSSNQQEWRQAMWSCRDVLHDLADYLWKDPRDTYDPLKGKDGNLKVTKRDYINRLAAYLHHKGTTGGIGTYLRAEMDRIYHSIDTLNQLDCKAHDIIMLSDVITAAMGTYFILGELVTRTDMQPVIRY